jgi:hypothetical protein
MKKYLFIIISLLVFSSCKKFLDVQPESDVTKEQLFSTEEGFKEALNGVYTYCSSMDLYGGNLTFSNLDIMAQNYEFTDINYQKIASFKYTDDLLKDKSNAIWTAGYKAVGNCNEILEVIDAKKGIFRDKNYEIIKGESLALRAYLHFDLLRMFAPSYKNSPGAPGIPYVNQVTIKTTPFSTVTEALDLVIADLTVAKDLLRNADPILQSNYIVGYPGAINADQKGTETNSATLFLQNRRHRINYFAVCAELARVYLYKNDNINSLLNANEVINSKKFPWTEKEDFFNTNVAQRDKIFYKELVFGWYIPGSKDHVVDLFSKIDAAYVSSTNQINQIYERSTVGADDWRRSQWFLDVAGNSTSRSYLVKYTTNSTPIVNLHPLMAPGLRLTEMYYIAAEASFDSDPAKAVDYFNTARIHRNIGTLIKPTISKTEFMDELVKECRKEFYGESQIFFMHKRLNRDVIATNGLIYPASNSIFVFPLPIDEQAFSNK